jgi:hypothetical protein
MIITLVVASDSSYNNVSYQKIALYEVLEIGSKSELLARFFAMFKGDINKC